MLFTKCILSERKPEDGVRISIMSRHTRPDGRTPDERIKGKFDIHLNIFGPSPRLIGGYYKRGIPWEKFSKKYQEEIQQEPKLFLVRLLAKLALLIDITILCIEEEHDHCHRLLLANECKIHEPRLSIEHR